MEFTMTLVQMPCEEGNREKNFERVKFLLEQSEPGRGVQFIMVPELFAIGFRNELFKWNC